MVKHLLSIIEEQGDKAKLVPISLLKELQEEMQELNQKYALNNYQKYLVNEMFSYKLPEVDFPIRSILVIATPSPAVRIYFNHNGEKLSHLLPSGYYDYFAAPGRIEGYLKNYLNSDNRHMALASQLPRKFLAAKSGLARYGRNNICYVEGMGCNINLIPFFTDLEVEAEDKYEAKVMETCDSCRKCIANCPTKAIREDHFLIDNERCLTVMNEAGADMVFPDWVSPSSHNAVVGCTICQEICPHNRKYMNYIIGPVEFTEEETKLLLLGVKEDQLPGEMRHKLEQLDLMGYLHSLPRNLKALLEKEA
ncbi:MAG TPA: 4Fe-4S double cluster binding domain-containing protein [Mobilitalea sp.]|nr:4Fe-4S double cluster binding domain-containing protein [Mobilitalea sp.]